MENQRILTIAQLSSNFLKAIDSFVDNHVCLNHLYVPLSIIFVICDKKEEGHSLSTYFFLGGEYYPQKELLNLTPITHLETTELQQSL